MKRTYQPSKLVRKRRHGYRARMATKKRPESRGRAPREGSQAPVGLMLTLKASEDFQRIARTGRKWTGSAFIMQVLKSEDASLPFRVGFTVSRRVGNAVQRNRAKRRLREMVRLFLKQQAPTGYDVVLIAKTSAGSMDFAAMCADFHKGLAAAGVS